MRIRSKSWLRTLNKCWSGADSQASTVCAGSMATAATALSPNVEKNTACNPRIGSSPKA